MRLNTNISAIISNNALQKAESGLELSIQRLSSGYKINSSEDDPAGCAISEKMRLQIQGLKQASNNASDGISVLNTAEGALSEIQSMLTRMKELTVQAANDVNSDSERQAIQDEIDSLNDEIDRISNDTEFNTQSLINGNLSRRVYSNYEGVKQRTVSDSYVAGDYGVTVTQDARQAVVVGDGTITMTDTETATSDMAGTISINGYSVTVSEGDSLSDILSNISSAADKIGASSFVIADGATNDTKTNGTEYAGYDPLDSDYTGNRLVIMTDQYGSDQTLNITCDNAVLAAKLGISDAAEESDDEENDGITAEGSDVQATFAQDTDGNRIGFQNSAVISTQGTTVSIKDVNGKSFEFDVTGNIVGTQFDDSTDSKNYDKSVATTSDTATVIQEVTDVGTMSIHIGSGQNQVLELNIGEVTTDSLGTDKINVMTGTTASQAIDIVDSAITKANAIRSQIGAYQNRFDQATDNLSVSSDNMTTALSQLVDTDMAEEMTEYTSKSVLVQAATSILSQANERPSTVLQLLQS